MHLVGEVAVRVRLELLGVASIDEPVQHERVERIERAAADDVLVCRAIAIGDPLLPIRSDAREVMVLSAAPDRIGVTEPEGRRVRARREIDVDFGLLGAELLYQVNRRVEVAVECATGKRPRGVSRSIKLELIHTVLANHAEAGIAKARVVLRSGEREATLVGLEALLLSELEPPLLRIAVAAPR